MVSEGESTDQKGYAKKVMHTCPPHKRLTQKQRRILSLLIATGSPTLVAKTLKKSQPAVTKVAKVLEKKGMLIIRKIRQNRNEYLLTQDGYLASQGIDEKVMQSRWRHHKLALAYYIRPALKEAWQKRRNQIATVKVKLTNNDQGHFRIMNIPAKTTTKGIIIYPDDLFGKERIDLDRQMIELVQQAGYALNDHFKMPLWKADQGSVEILSQELAHMQDPLAKEFIAQEERMIVKVDGERRLIIDYSPVNGTPTPETEGVHAKECPEDMHKWEKHSKAIITGIFDHEAILTRLQALESVAMKTTELMEHKFPVPEQRKLPDFRHDYIG